MKDEKSKMIISNEKQLIWKYQRLLRKIEYYTNCKKSIYAKVYLKYLNFLLFKKQAKYGFHISPNCFGPGLSIAHIGPIVINANAKVGFNCRLHVGTNIGMNGRDKETATLGDNVYLATGSVIIGELNVANGVVIGANAVVTKSIEQENITVAGVPALKVSDNGNGFPLERRGYEIAVNEMNINESH